MMPLYAKRSGATLFIINMTETPLGAHADIVLTGKAGELLSEILRRVRS